MYKFPHNRLLVSLVLAYGNNKDKVNEVLHAYELPELSDATAQMYFQRAKTYPVWAKDVINDMVMYFKQIGYVPATELLAALRVASNMQLRCIVNAGIILGRRIEGAPELLMDKELQIYKSYFFDPTGWTMLDWNDYTKCVNSYEKKVIRLALSGKEHELQIALQLVTTSTEEEILHDMMSKAYKNFVRLESRISELPENTSVDTLKAWRTEAEAWHRMVCNGYRAKMAGHAALNNASSNNSNDKENDLPPFRLIYIDENGNLAVEKTREELEAQMKAKMIEDEARYKALSDKAAGGNTDTADSATKS